MSLLQEITNIRTEDFPGQKDWISKLLLPINQFLLQATNAINGGITFGDNIPTVDTVLKFTFGSALSDFPKSFAWNKSVRPVEVRVTSATENSTPVTLFLTWSYANNKVTISSIFKGSASGLTSLVAGATYNINLRGHV